MGTIFRKFKPAPFITLVTCVCLLFASGCARYARNVNTLYEPSATAHGGTGEVYIVIPESRQTRATGVKWVLGTVKDRDNMNIDEVFSPRSPAEIIQAALGRELKKAGYTVIPTSKRPAVEQRVIDLTKTEIMLDQISDLANLKAECRIQVAMDVSINGELLKRIKYESKTSKSDIKDRDMLAIFVLEDALKSVMLEAIPDLHTLFKPVIAK